MIFLSSNYFSHHARELFARHLNSTIFCQADGGITRLHNAPIDQFSKSDNCTDLGNAMGEG